jgi:MoaA/NifB/PqqE/SkfB family radical SAM enzyme
MTPSSTLISGYKREWLWMMIKLRIFYLTCIVLKSPRKILKSYKLMATIRNNIWGGNMKKIHRIGNQYYSNMYSPPWPSVGYDDYVKCEIKRYAAPLTATQQLSFVFLAITRKCPLRCEHCFEADNLNNKELFSKIELLKAVRLLQKEGALQFHFSGGEPMVRFKDLIEVIHYASKKSACWVATSGFNLTVENALLLKKAGCVGVIISIDHYIPELHNNFRHHPDSFRQAVQAVEAAKRAGLVTCLSVCTTKRFLDGNHLVPYMYFAKRLGVQFVQALEPKNVGNYDGKDVLLHPSHVKQLEKIFLDMNYSAEYKEFPTMLYHGYHQNRIGCFAGSRSIYVDSIGDVHACPFCHTRSYNILDVIRSKNYTLPAKENTCMRYKSVV